MRMNAIILACLLITAILISGCVEKPFEKSQPEEVSLPSKILTLDSQKEATHFSVVDEFEEAFWKRSRWFHWNLVEPEGGRMDWEAADEIIRQYQDMDIYVLLVIFPFANWDQETCHPGEEYISKFDPKKGGDLRVGKPCDMDAYRSFLKKVVERYDGDGIDDMPGLEIPIKYYEIMNEPDTHGKNINDETSFFYGTPQEYLDILKVSYETIKEADPDAKVLHAGMAGLDEEFQEFWKEAYSLGATNYFDISNIHSIDTDEKREDLFLFKFLELTKGRGIQDRPIWVTETQFGGLAEAPEDIGQFEETIVKASVFALANGIDKIFYISNWLYWDEESDSTQDVYETLVRYINKFDKVEILKQEYAEHQGDRESITTIVGQYKFTDGNEVIYFLWGNAKLPSEISGEIKVTDIYGKNKIIDAVNLVLSDNPIIVELIK